WGYDGVVGGTPSLPLLLLSASAPPSLLPSPPESLDNGYVHSRSDVASIVVGHLSTRVPSASKSLRDNSLVPTFLQHRFLNSKCPPSHFRPPVFPAARNSPSYLTQTPILLQELTGSFQMSGGVTSKPPAAEVTRNTLKACKDSHRRARRSCVLAQLPRGLKETPLVPTPRLLIDRSLEGLCGHSLILQSVEGEKSLPVKR
ncbi:hypothetical protein Hamer_G023610, partial [Homarus americanus]